MTGLILHRWQEEDKKRLRQRPLIPTDTEALVPSPLLPMVSVWIHRIPFDTSLWRNLLIAGVFTPYRNGSIHCACTSLLGGRDCFVKLRGQASTLLL